MKYRHYKGGIYEIICEARLESDPNVIMIIYKSMDGQTWVRPQNDFFALIQHEGSTVQRFTLIN